MLLPDATVAKDRRDLVGHGGPIKAMRVAPDGTTALSGSFDYSMIVWSLSAEKPVVQTHIREHDSAVNAVAYTPDGERAVSGADDGTVAIWDLKTGEALHRFKDHGGKVVDVAVSADGRLAVSAGWDRTARLWHVDDPAPGPVLEGHTNNVNAVAFSPDGARVYTASYDGTIRSWRLPDGVLERTVYNHGWGINTLQVLPGGTKILFGALNGSVRLIDAATGGGDEELVMHDGPVLASAIDSRHGLVATGGSGGHIYVWDLEDFRVKYSFENPNGPIWALDFVDDGQSMYFAGLDDTAFLWQMNPARPFEPARGTVPRRFQVSEEVGLGERQFARKCSVCHTLSPDDANRAGPSLYGLFGRRAGTLEGYPYSDALKTSTIVWNEETIGKLFDIGPEHYTPGTKMPLQRIKNARIREALIAYLRRATDPDAGDPAAGTN